MSRLKELYTNEIMDAMTKKFGYKNVMQVPKLDKIVINMGVGEAKENAKLLDAAIADMELITGQKAIATKAKKSVANFKISGKIGHTFQKNHSIFREIQILQSGIAFNCLESFSCTHFPMTCHTLMTFLVIWMHGCNIDSFCRSKRYYFIFCKSRFSASASSGHDCHHINSAPRTGPREYHQMYLMYCKE